jgi:hypothetical protein
MFAVGRKADGLALYKPTVAKFKEVKTGWPNSRQIWQNPLIGAAAQIGLFCQ